jgi:hypothetical protein
MMVLADWTLSCVDDSSSTWFDPCDWPSFMGMDNSLKDRIVRSMKGKERREETKG